MIAGVVVVAAGLISVWMEFNEPENTSALLELLQGLTALQAGFTTAIWSVRTLHNKP